MIRTQTARSYATRQVELLGAKNNPHTIERVGSSHPMSIPPVIGLHRRGCRGQTWTCRHRLGASRCCITITNGVGIGRMMGTHPLYCCIEGKRTTNVKIFNFFRDTNECLLVALMLCSSLVSKTHRNRHVDCRVNSDGTIG